MKKPNKKLVFLVALVALAIGLSILGFVVSQKEEEKRILERQRAFEKLQWEAKQYEVFGDLYIKRLEERQKWLKERLERDLLKEEIKNEIKFEIKHGP